MRFLLDAQGRITIFLILIYDSPAIKSVHQPIGQMIGYFRESPASNGAFSRLRVEPHAHPLSRFDFAPYAALRHDRHYRFKDNK
jgi:hypothetical protein